MRQLPRLLKLPDGGLKTIMTGVCECMALARGPLGGVCGACNGAIPSVQEMRRLNSSIRDENRPSNLVTP